MGCKDKIAAIIKPVINLLLSTNLHSVEFCLNFILMFIKNSKISNRKICKLWYIPEVNYHKYWNILSTMLQCGWMSKIYWMKEDKHKIQFQSRQRLMPVILQPKLALNLLWNWGSLELIPCLHLRITKVASVCYHALTFLKIYLNFFFFF